MFCRSDESKLRTSTDSFTSFTSMFLHAALVYTGLNDNTQRWPHNIWIHLIWGYQNRINQMSSLNDACYPIPVGYWPAQHSCGYHDECGKAQGTGYCIRGYCQPSLLSIGQDCSNDEECGSGLCEKQSGWLLLPFVSTKQCRTLYVGGDSCSTSHQCASGTCEQSGGWFREKRCA